MCGRIGHLRCCYLFKPGSKLLKPGSLVGLCIQTVKQHPVRFVGAAVWAWKLVSRLHFRHYNDVVHSYVRLTAVGEAFVERHPKRPHVARLAEPHRDHALWSSPPYRERACLRTVVLLLPVFFFVGAVVFAAIAVANSTRAVDGDSGQPKVRDFSSHPSGHKHVPSREIAVNERF